MANTSITIRIDESLKRQMEALCEDIGMNLTTAYVIFTKAAVRKWKIPFSIEGDDFNSLENQKKRLKKSIEDGKRGKFITVSIDELKAIADE